MDLTKDPIKVQYVDRDMNITQTFLFTGTIPTNLIDEIEKVNKSPNTESNVLKSFYGPNWKNKLGFVTKPLVGGSVGKEFLDPVSYGSKGSKGSKVSITQKVGGSVSKEFLDPGEDILDISELNIPGIEQPIPKVPKVPIIQKVVEKHVFNVIKDINIFPEDRISDVKLKMYALGGSKIYNQHMFVQSRGQVIPMRYKITADGIIPVDVVKAFSEDAKIHGFPSDHNIFPNRQSLRVVAFDYVETVGDIFKKLGTTTFYILDLEPMILGSLGTLREQFKQDKIHFELFYYSFIVKFWPMISLGVFDLIVKGEKIKGEYPDLEPSVSRLLDRFHIETKLLNRKYKLLRDAGSGFKKFPKFRKLSPQIDKPDPNGVIDVAIKSAVLEVESSAKGSSLVGKTQIDMQQLYRNLDTSYQIPIIKTNLIIDNKPMILTKYDQSVPDIQQSYDQIRYRMQLPYFNSILFAVRLSKQNPGFLVVVIRNNGKYMVRSVWEKQMDFKTMFNIIKDAINPHIVEINKLGRAIFSSASRLRTIEIGNSEFSNLSMTMTWKQPISENGFKKFGEFLKDDFAADILRSKTGMVDSDEITPNTIEFTIHKGITDIDPRSIEKSVIVNNYYSYLTDAKIKMKWNQLMEGKPIIITRRTADVRFDLSDLREKEFRYFYTYFITRMFDAKDQISVKGAPSRSKTQGQNRLKYLKEKDPVLFKFKRFGSDIVYSRICQKAYQPEVYSDNELSNLPSNIRNKAVKYWNFTTKTPAYYVCPNPKFPALSFIHDKHPKKFCLPCCKKSPSYEFSVSKKDKRTGKSKKSSIYNICLEHHCYDESETAAANNRYIMKYGKPLDLGRISYTPHLLDKFLKYNISDTGPSLGDKGGIVTGDYGFGQKAYSVDELWRITKNNKSRVVPVETLLEQLTSKAWSYKAVGEPDYSPMDIIENPNLSSTHYNRITNADMSFPILIYRNIQDNWQEVLDGLHRLAKAHIQKKPTIIVKYVTRRQLEKAEIHHDKPIKQKPSKLDDLKKPGYYLYGVPQNSSALTDIGGIFSIATALGMTLDEFVKDSIKRLQETAKTKHIMYFKSLLGGKLARYFDDMTHLIQSMKRLFIKSDIKLNGDITGFRLWNELFIDIAKYVWNKHVILFDDRSTDISGTSIKHSDISEDIRIVLPDKVSSGVEFIPISTDEAPVTKEFVLILRKRKKSRNIFSHNYLYYPIFIFTPHEFFKTLKVDKMVYTQDDEIMSLVRGILSDTLTAGVSVFEINLDIISKFLKTISGEITKAYVTGSDLCYALDIKWNKGVLTIPINYSTYGHLNTSVQRTPLKRPSQNYKHLKEFMREYNKFVVSESEKRGMIRIGEKGESGVTPVYPFMKIDELLEFKSQIIGISSNGLYYYFDPIQSSKSLIEYIQNGPDKYNLFRHSPKIHQMLHDPDQINNHIWNYFKTEISTKDARSNLISQAYYDRYIYQMLVMEILQYLDNESNTPIRNRIKKLLSVTKFRDIDSLNVFRDELESELNEFPGDIELIREIVNEYYVEHFNKDIMIYQFDTQVFQFDRITLNEIEKVTTNFYNSDNPDAVIKTIKKKIMQICLKIVSVSTDAAVKKSLDSSKTGIVCSTDTIGCIKGKLVVTQSNLDTMVDLLAADFINPLKREYLLASIYVPKLLDEFKFTKKRHEQIYIKSFVR